MKKIIILLPLLFLLQACDERYRYPCQDPDNWEEKICKKPYCSANGTCPEDLTHYEKEKRMITMPQAPQTQQCQPVVTARGACKK